MILSVADFSMRSVEQSFRNLYTFCIFRVKGVRCGVTVPRGHAYQTCARQEAVLRASLPILGKAHMAC